MQLTMKAPASRDKGQRTVRCNEQQADILRKVGWTEVIAPNATVEHIPLVTNVAAHYLAEATEPDPPKTTPDGKPISYPPVEPTPPYPPFTPGENQTISPEPLVDPDRVRPKKGSPYLQQDDYKISDIKKRKYTRRDMSKPKRQYRRRDMKAED